MKWPIFPALAVALLSGCAGLEPTPGPGSPAGAAASARPGPKLAGLERPGADTVKDPQAVLTKGEIPAVAPAPLPSPDPLPATASLPDVAAQPKPLEVPPHVPALSPPAAPVPPQPEVPAPAPVATSHVVEVSPKAELQPPPSAPAPAAKPLRPDAEGRQVASVGEEVIRLPELTAAVKARLAMLPKGKTASRREVMALAKTTLKGMIVRSLVLQEAREKLGGIDRVEAAIGDIENRWDEDELPRLIARENVEGQADLRDKLWTRCALPETVRDEFITRSLAMDLMRRDGSTKDVEAYLDALRKRRPITSIMSQAELAAAGRLEATRR